MNLRVPVRKGVAHLPGAEAAWIPTSPNNKLKDYLLNLDHPAGGSKAEWFRARLGILQDDWEFLHDQILDRVPACWVCNIRFKPPDGVEFGVEVPINGRNGRSAPIVTGWFVPPGVSPSPKLVTAHP